MNLFDLDRTHTVRLELIRSQVDRVIFAAICTALCGLSGCVLPGRDGSVPKSVVQARQLSHRGIIAMERGDWVRAETLLGQATQACPADMEAHRHFAEVLWHRGAKAQAIQHMEEAIKLSSEDAQLYVRCGEMYLDLGKTEDALRLADRAMAVEPKSAEAWKLRGRAQQAGSDHPAALADFQRGLGYRRDDRQLLLQTAEVYRQKNQPQRALVALQALIDTYNPGEEPQQVLQLEGLAFVSLARDDDAVESYNLALQRGPATPELQFRLAEAHLGAGRFQEAQKQVQRALTLDPKHPASQALLERIQVAQRNPGMLR